MRTRALYKQGRAAVKRVPGTRRLRHLFLVAYVEKNKASQELLLTENKTPFELPSRSFTWSVKRGRVAMS